MRIPRLWLLLFVPGVLVAQEKAPDKPRVLDTPRVSDKLRLEETRSFDFLAGGLVRIAKSSGALTIEAWDKPTVELTTTKSAKPMRNVHDQEKAAAEMPGISIAAEHQGNELAVTTTRPKGARYIDISYHLFVPRDTRLAIDHGTGEVNIEGIAAAIDAKLHKGELFLYLPDGFSYNVKAESSYGGINVPEDSPLHPVHLHLGHTLVHETPGASSTLAVQVGHGDIYIMRQTPVPPATN